MDRPARPGYELKLNSYDIGVDLELHDAIQRLRFEHPEVRCVVLTSGRDRIFCAGANIHMLASSSHGFKVNFCKFTNETRLSIEDASRHSGQKFLAALDKVSEQGGQFVFWRIGAGRNRIRLENRVGNRCNRGPAKVSVI